MWKPNYRLKRKESLCRLAHKVAAKVVKYCRTRHQEPLTLTSAVIHIPRASRVEKSQLYSMGTEPSTAGSIVA